MVALSDLPMVLKAKNMSYFRHNSPMFHAVPLNIGGLFLGTFESLEIAFMRDIDLVLNEVLFDNEVSFINMFKYMPWLISINNQEIRS